MAEFLLITSPQNPKIKQALKLREKRMRDRTQTFLIEGYRELLRAFEGGVCLTALFYSPDHFLGAQEQLLVKKISERGIPCARVDKKVFEKISYRDRPDGLLAIAKQEPLSLEDLDRRPNQPTRAPFFVVAQGIEKPGNLGSILRSCDAAQVDALFVCDPCTDIYNPNVVRASVGTLFTLPVIQVTTQTLLAWLEKNGIPIVATTPHAPLCYTESDFTGPLAIAMGTEQLGLSKEWMKSAAVAVRIPMYGVADSLNVAAATTLLLYEVLRQRS